MTENGSSNLVMPVSPMYGGGYGGGFGFGGDWSWIIILLLLGGWGNGGWGGGFGGGFGGMYEFPWLLNGQQGINSNTNAGFRDAMLQDSITSVRDGISGLSSQLCNCCCDMRQEVANGFYTAEVAAANRQMANMNQMFGLQNSINQGFNGVQSSLCNGFNGTQMGLADLKYTVATENCADRNTSTQNTQAILMALNSGVQSIKDQLCQDKIDAKNDEISQLRQEVLYARGQASQIAQNSTIIDGVYNRLDSCPVSTTPVFGRTPIFSCTQNSCGCNGNTFFN